MKLISFWRLACFGICFCLWGTEISHAQNEQSLKITTELCQMDFFQSSSTKSDLKSNEANWLVPLKTREGRAGIAFGTPIYLKIEIKNNCRQIQTLKMFFMQNWSPTNKKYEQERRWLQLQLKKGKNRPIEITNYKRPLGGGGIHTSWSGGPELVSLSPNEAYQEAICLNSYYKIEGYGDFQLKTSVDIVLRNEGDAIDETRIYREDEGKRVKQDCDLTFKVWNYNRFQTERSFSGFTQALSKTMRFSPMERAVMEGWLAFPLEESLPAWQNYINSGNSVKMLDALDRSKTLTCATLGAYIAGCELCPQETRLNALANLKIMKMWEKDLKDPILSQFVNEALDRLKGRVPGDGVIVKAPSDGGG